MAVLTYHKFPKEAWREEEFQSYQIRLQGGEVVTLSKLSEQGHQTAILTTNFQAGLMTVAASLFARWCQENFFRYMREHYGFDRLVEYGTEQIPDAVPVVNPEWRKLDSQIRS